MERVYAFIDESGAFGGDTTNPTVSKYFIVTAILFKQSDLEEARIKTEKIPNEQY